MVKRFATGLPQDAVEIVVARLDVQADMLAALVGLLQDEERRRAARFPLARDCRRYIVARARLRQQVAARLGTEPRAVRFRRGIHGKPVLARSGSGWKFNASRSGELALMAFCRGRELGVDVEAVRAVPDADAIAALHFPPRELARYRALAPRDREQGFCGGWTRTEAVLKAMGTGLQQDSARCDDAGWRLHSFCPAPGYVAALAVERS